MVNQRGQAFSVFELMLAAIVVIVILFILLPLIPIPDLYTGDPVKLIGKAIESNSSKVDTLGFKIEPGQTIRTSSFTKQGIDECSFYFDNGRFSDEKIEVIFDHIIEDGCDSAIINKTSSPINAKATVLCDVSADYLEQSIINANLDDILSNFPTSIWGSWDYDLGFEKVCVVVLQYGSN